MTIVSLEELVFGQQAEIEEMVCGHRRGKDRKHKKVILKLHQKLITDHTNRKSHAKLVENGKQYLLKKMSNPAY